MTDNPQVRVATQGGGETCLPLTGGVWVTVVMWYTIKSVPMIMVGFAGSVSQGTSRESGTTLIPPSFMLTLKTWTLPSQRLMALSVSHGGLLERDICVILGPCIEALVGFHALGGDTCLRGKSVCRICHRKMSITLTSPKLDRTQGTRASKLVGQD